MFYEIKNRIDGSVIFSLECGSVRLCVEAAISCSADLSFADLRSANLRSADLVDGGQDARGFRFWAWRANNGSIVYRAGCHEWRDIGKALAWYGDSYSSNGDRAECIARIELMRGIAMRRWPESFSAEAAA